MKANELRIGNWVHHLAAGWTYRQPTDSLWSFDFQWDDRDWYALSEATMDLNYIEPIHLTEEWLLKFGFEDCDDPEFNKYAKAKMYYRGFLQVGAHRFGESYIINHPTFLAGYAINHIEYVHQLQNLYFCLCGEELTIANQEQTPRPRLQE